MLFNIIRTISMLSTCRNLLMAQILIILRPDKFSVPTEYAESIKSTICVEDLIICDIMGTTSYTYRHSQVSNVTARQ